MTSREKPLFSSVATAICSCSSSGPRSPSASEKATMNRMGKSRAKPRANLSLKNRRVSLNERSRACPDHEAHHFASDETRKSTRAMMRQTTATPPRSAIFFSERSVSESTRLTEDALVGVDGVPVQREPAEEFEHPGVADGEERAAEHGHEHGDEDGAPGSLVLRPRSRGDDERYRAGGRGDHEGQHDTLRQRDGPRDTQHDERQYEKNDGLQHAAADACQELPGEELPGGQLRGEQPLQRTVAPLLDERLGGEGDREEQEHDDDARQQAVQDVLFLRLLVERLSDNADGRVPACIAEEGPGVDLHLLRRDGLADERTERTAQLVLGGEARPPRPGRWRRLSGPRHRRCRAV